MTLLDDDNKLPRMKKQYLKDNEKNYATHKLPY